VACDAAQIERVIDNLLSNAIKYGGGKPIELVARRARAHVIVRVKDRGIGVGRADGARIFDPLGRSDVARSYPGLGLGLWLARTIVEAHGGSVRVTGGGGGGGPGGGSVFEISLPRIPTPGT
jgi:signal transduction histidine kinase